MVAHGDGGDGLGNGVDDRDSVVTVIGDVDHDVVWIAGSGILATT
jgi:hypothetical protein